ncbi:twin transmembrane helix small protein [Permianibacter sp. IMCC34836]|uniref:twin transmembrane helix small protein n=1 Tax=Permianibacter fluminis TaxID=2738515 RepID=UPI00155562B4|nr:twin transmembrane helix small protein [Permianibacter fluminis]NQD36915.1 twin transmembrane helix small protein [Permianibacter fluminis]
MWWAKAVVIVILLAILFVLFRGLFFLVKDQGDSKRTVNSLTWRVGLSALLLLVLILSIKFGILVPHGVAG